MDGKLIIFSAPSGSGKTTIVKHLLNTKLPLEFSISACNRKNRKGEKDGIDYYFLTDEEFRHKISQNEFIEWEEVYPGRLYGTLKSEIERIWKNGKHVIFDLDVLGGLNLKKKFGKTALSIFVQAPSRDEIERRLRARSTEDEVSLAKRLAKIEKELNFATSFDTILINNKLEQTLKEAEKLVRAFIEPNSVEI